MKRFYLSKIKEYDDGGSVAYRHRIQELDPPVDYVGGEIKADPQTGIPVEKALLVLVGGVSHAALAADPELVQIPVVDIFMKVGSTHTPTKLAFKAKAISLDLDEEFVNGLMSNPEGWIEVINELGRLNNDTFDAQNFDLDES